MRVPPSLPDLAPWVVQYLAVRLTLHQCWQMEEDSLLRVWVRLQVKSLMYQICQLPRTPRAPVLLSAEVAAAAAAAAAAAVAAAAAAESVVAAAVMLE